MKRIITIAIILLMAITANAQTDNDASKTIIDSGFMRELLSTSGALVAVFLITTFILNFVRLVLDNRIKNRLIEKGAAENLVSQLLQPFSKENKMEPIKWFCILAGIGLGLSLINYTQPLGIHSLAIMSFSLAASFLGYYFFNRKNEK
jgi:hypothetical protein